MLFAVIFTDRPDQGALRSQHLQAHIDWVAAHQDQVRVAGSLREEMGQVPKGGLWIVEAPSKKSTGIGVRSQLFEAAIKPRTTPCPRRSPVRSIAGRGFQPCA
jgi:hypothetical protein